MRIKGQMRLFYMKIGVVLVLQFGYLSTLFSQNPLSLEDCFNQALDNSPSLKRDSLNVIAANIGFFQAQMNFLPSLNAGATHGYNWGQSIDPFTNTFATARVRTNNFSLRSTWEIFSGFVKRYNLDLAELNIQTAEQQYLLEKRNFKNEIASVYAKILTDQLNLNTFEQQYDLITKLYKNISRLEETGRRSPFDKLRIQALVQQDSAAVIAARNSLELSKFLLKQLINAPDSLKNTMQFELLDENQMLKSLRPIDEWNVDSILELRVAQLNLANAQMALKIAKAGYLPTLTLNSALGSGYSGNNTTLVGTTPVAKPMGTQIRENLYQTAVLSLFIPIFNQYSVKNNVKLSQIQIDQARLEMEASRLEIINNVQRLVIDYENELVNLKAKKLVLETNEALFEAVDKMFLVGTSNYADFVEGKFALTRAQLDYQVSLSTAYGLRLLLDNFIGQ